LLKLSYSKQTEAYFMPSTTIDITTFLNEFNYVGLIENEAKTRFGRFLMAFKNQKLTLSLKKIAGDLQIELRDIKGSDSEKNKNFLDIIENSLKKACKARWDVYAAKNPDVIDSIKKNHFNVHMPLNAGRFEKEIIRSLTKINNALCENMTTGNGGECFTANPDKHRINLLIEQAKNPNTHHILDLIDPIFKRRQTLATSGTESSQEHPFNM